MTPFLQTHRLLLRGLRMDDLDRFHELINVPEVAALNTSIPHPLSLKRARAWVDYYADTTLHGKDLHWAICLKSDQSFIGVINLYDVSEDFRQAEIGFWIGKDYWNRKLTSEAVQTVVDYARTETKIRSIIASYHPMNIASAKLLANTGFTRSKTVRIFNRKQQEWVVMKQTTLNVSESILV